MARLPRSLRGWLALVALATIAGALCLPPFQALVLPAAGGLGTGLLQVMIIGVGLILGLPALFLAIPSDTDRLLVVIRGVVLSLLVPLSAFVGYQYAHHIVHAVLGPRTTLVIPDGYEGSFDILIDHRVHTRELAALGRRDTYVAPSPEDQLRVEKGWLEAGFSFDDGGRSVGGAYRVKVVSTNGRGRRRETFRCRWTQLGDETVFRCQVGSTAL